MIDYVKLFTQKLNNNFDEYAKHCVKHIAKMRKAGIQHLPRRYKFNDICTFGLSIEKENEDNLPWAEGQAEAYIQKIAELNRRSKIKSIDIKLYRPEDDRPDTVPPHPETLLVGKIEFTR